MTGKDAFGFSYLGQQPSGGQGALEGATTGKETTGLGFPAPRAGSVIQFWIAIWALRSSPSLAHTQIGMFHSFGWKPDVAIPICPTKYCKEGVLDGHLAGGLG